MHEGSSESTREMRVMEKHKPGLEDFSFVPWEGVFQFHFPECFEVCLYTHTSPLLPVCSACLIFQPGSSFYDRKYMNGYKSK